MMTMRHDFLTFIGARASIDLADVIDVTMATVAVVEDALGIILWLTDEESFHVGIDDGGRRLGACARRIENNAGGLLWATRRRGHSDQQ